MSDETLHRNMFQRMCLIRAFEERERLVERQVALFELLDDFLELGDRRFEILDRGGRRRCRHARVSVRAGWFHAAGQLALGIEYRRAERLDAH